MSESQERYEGLFVLDPELPEEVLVKLQGALAEQITKAGGGVERQQSWGKRRLAYRVRRRRDGVYLCVVFRLPAPAFRTVDQWCALQDGILRRLILRAAETSPQLVEATTGHGDAE